MRRWLLFCALALLGATACAAYLSALATDQPRPLSYREAVERVLATNRLQYRTVEVVDGCAPSFAQCRTYSGRVRVRTDAAILEGRIDCRKRWSSCTLSLPDAALEAVALPDIVDPGAFSLEAAWARVRLWFRSFAPVR